MNAEAESSRAAIRRALRARRTALDAGARKQASLAVADRLVAFEALSTPANVAIYWAVRAELPLLHAAGALLRGGHRLHLPIVRDDATLVFAPWRPGDATEPNRFGIPEPVVAATDVVAAAALDVVLVPLVAFDRRGTRLGSGAGFYDRSFAFLLDRPRPARPFLIGVGYAFQEVPVLDSASWDVPLDAVVTEQALLRIGG